MRRPSVPPRRGPDSVQTHLSRSSEAGRPAFWTEALADPPQVYGERVRFREGRCYRRWDPFRSKLSAALARGWGGRLPRPGERWLYLGAATGTTASHIADLVGVRGTVYAVEKSVRPFIRLLRLAERYPNLYPILADARRPEEYAGLVPPVDGLYVDVAQPDQAEIADRNGAYFLRDPGRLLLALKLASLSRTLADVELLAAARRSLGAFRLEGAPVALEPFHRRHVFLELSRREAPSPEFRIERAPRRVARMRPNLDFLGAGYR
jgi:fibrillarin-like pre-rRNA processing protein